MGRSKHRALKIIAALLVVVVVLAVGYSWTIRPWVYRVQHGHLERLLVQANEVLELCDVNYFIDRGTLLGVTRGGTLLTEDTTVDLMLCSVTDWERLRVCQEEHKRFEKMGLHFENLNDFGALQLRDRFGFLLHIDTCSPDKTASIINPQNDHLLTAVSRPECQPGEIDLGDNRLACTWPEQIVLPVRRVPFHTLSPKTSIQLQLPVPANPNTFLELEYGDWWEVPQKYDKGSVSSNADIARTSLPWLTELCTVLWTAVTIMRVDHPVTCFIYLLLLTVVLSAILVARTFARWINRRYPIESMKQKVEAEKMKLLNEFRF